MATINIIVASLALIGGILCGRAFLPHINILGKRPTEYLARGLFLCALSGFPRIAHWDVLRPVTGQIWSMPGANLAFDLVMLLGIYFILKARWLTIPDDERGDYNIITAVFYPKNIMPRLRRDSDGK